MEQGGSIESAGHLEKNRPGSRHYMPGLDGLRALAVLAVIAYHLHLPWAMGGLLGVSVFFVLSGYLITDILLGQWDLYGGINLKEFWLGRIRRLLPALFVMLAGVLLWIYLYDPGRLDSVWSDVIAAVFYSSNWWLIFQQVSYFSSFGPPAPLGHLWSLAVEEQFYLLWPLLLGIGLRYIPCRARLIGLITALMMASAVAMAVIYQPGQDPSRVYYGTDTRAFALFIGAVLAFVWPSRKLSADLSPGSRRILDVAGGAALLIISLMIWLGHQYQAYLYYGGLLLFSLATMVLIAVLAHPASQLGKIFAIAPLRWLGIWSYGIYLWHYPLIVLSNPTVNTGGLDISLSIKQILLAVFLAAVSWYFIEDPIRRGKWKRHSGQLSDDFNGQPQVLGFRGRVKPTGIGLMFCVAVVLVGGCSLISPAQQKGLISLDPRGIEPPRASAQEPPLWDNEAGGVRVQFTLAADAPEPAEDNNEALSGLGVTVIGDSVIVEVEEDLKRLLPDIEVDAAIGRQMHQATEVIMDLEAQGRLGHTVVIALGANGAFTEQQFLNILDLLGDDRRIVLVNVRVPKPWEGVVNQSLSRFSTTNPNIELLDWYSASSGHNEYFYTDGVHLKETGVKAYAGLLANAANPSVQ